MSDGKTPLERAWFEYWSNTVSAGCMSCKFAFEAGWNAALLGLVDPEAPGWQQQRNRFGADYNFGPCCNIATARLSARLNRTTEDLVAAKERVRELEAENERGRKHDP